MITERVHAPERIVEGEAQPRERPIIIHVKRREHPPQVIPTETPVMRVCDEVVVISGSYEAGVQARKKSECSEAENQDRKDGANFRRSGGSARLALTIDAFQPAPNSFCAMLLAHGIFCGERVNFWRECAAAPNIRSIVTTNERSTIMFRVSKTRNST